MPTDVIDAPQPPKPSPSRDLTYEFIDKYYMRQPKALRSITFGVFVFLFAYAFVKLVGGTVVFSGTVFEPNPSGQLQVAKNYDVRAGVDQLVGTNSKGEYHLILGNVQAAALLARGALNVQVTDKDGHLRGRRGGLSVSVNRATMSLDDLYLDAESPTITQTGARLELGLFPVLHAAARPGNRLFIRQLTSKSGGSVTLRCMNGCGVAGQPLRASLSGGAEAGPIPVAAGRTIAYDFDYYFDVPIDSDGVDIAASAESGAKQWFVRDEHFVLGRAPGRLPEVGEELPFGGTMGSRLVVLMLSPDDVVVYAKADIVAKLPRLKTALRSSGLGYVEQPAPLGEASETNALFVGTEVAVDNAQKALRSAQQLGIAIKTVRKRELKSGNQHQIQLGGVAALKNAAPLPPALVQQLLAAKSDAEFWSRAR